MARAQAHVRMAWNYLREHGRDVGTAMIRTGIQRYNEQNKCGRARAGERASARAR